MLPDYTTYPTLVDTLPPLVRKQRRLEAQIVPLAAVIDEEKALRKDIDQLLLDAGITRGEGVSCLGYDVTHIERTGTSRLNQDLLVVKLAAAGLEMRVILEIVAASTEVGDPSMWAVVKPSKGSKVRTS